MSIDRHAIIDLDTLVDETTLFQTAPESADAPPRLRRLTFSVENWERLKTLMLELRSENVAVILLLKKRVETDAPVPEAVLTDIFTHLRMWDQFTLHNLLELCGAWFTPRVLSPLTAEARIEMKWFEEWSTAATDTRLHKYPTLPWRRFIRKATTENYAFFTKLLAEWGSGDPDEEKKVESVVAEFLREKRKAVNIAPKRFKKESTPPKENPVP